MAENLLDQQDGSISSEVYEEISDLYLNSCRAFEKALDLSEGQDHRNYMGERAVRSIAHIERMKLFSSVEQKMAGFFKDCQSFLEKNPENMSVAAFKQSYLIEQEIYKPILDESSKQTLTSAITSLQEIKAKARNWAFACDGFIITGLMVLENYEEAEKQLRLIIGSDDRKSMSLARWKLDLANLLALRANRETNQKHEKLTEAVRIYQEVEKRRRIGSIGRDGLASKRLL